MKASPTVTTRYSLRFVALFLMCCAILVHFSAANEIQLEQSEREQIIDQVFDDGAKIGDGEKHTLLHRQRKSAKNNVMVSLSEVQKRLRVIEERHNKSATLMEKRFQEMEKRFIKRLDTLVQTPHSSDSSLLSYLLVRDGRNNGKQSMGPPGPPGKPGVRGDNGAQGAKGDKGQAASSGVKYVRWGKTSCPNGAQIVYKGIVGGENYGHSGGGVNYLCLPKTPKYDRYKDGHQGGGYVEGAEFELSFNPFQKSLNQHDPPCVVCFVKSRGSMLMMPARNDCPTGWTEEYHGYLMTAGHGHKKQGDFICIDKDAESIPGSQANKNGALLYLVEGTCGNLPCGPYVKGRELTCAVCTK